MSLYEESLATLSFSCSESYTIFIIDKNNCASFILMQDDRKILFTAIWSNLLSLKHLYHNYLVLPNTK